MRIEIRPIKDNLSRQAEQDVFVHLLKSRNDGSLVKNGDTSDDPTPRQELDDVSRRRPAAFCRQ